MRDFVSNRRMRMVVLAASMSAVWAVFILQGFRWTSLVWVILAFSAALWVGTEQPPSRRRWAVDDGYMKGDEV